MNYLYGTCEKPLPDIYSVYTPELQQQYPFAIVYKAPFDYGLCITTLPLYKVAGENKWAPVEGTAYCRLSFTGTDGNPTTWGAFSEANETTKDAPSNMLPRWSNYDIYNEDGTVYLAASDPIPVSSFTPDPSSLTMGWLVGRRIAGQRK